MNNAEIRMVKAVLFDMDRLLAAIRNLLYSLEAEKKDIAAPVPIPEIAKRIYDDLLLQYSKDSEDVLTYLDNQMNTPKDYRDNAIRKETSP